MMFFKEGVQDKEKMLLVGAGGFGRMVAEQAMYQYDCAFVDDGQSVGTEVCGIPVVGSLADLPELRKEYGLLVVGIGNNRFRAQVYEKANALGYGFPNIVAPSAYISPYAKLGCGCVVLQNACVQNGASVGNGVLLNAGTEVHCDAAVGDYALIYTNSVIRTGATVGSLTRIGSNVTVCNHAVVPDGADIPDCTAVHSEVKQ